MKKIYKLNEISNFKINFKIPDLIYLKGDLWSWKTTFVKNVLNNIFEIKQNITSPTYTYYNKYEWYFEAKKINIYHFDLYRLKDYDEFFAIGWEDIFDFNDWIIFVEWPELVEKYYKPNLTIKLNLTQKKDEREIEII